MRKRRAFAALILICVMLLLPLPVSANSPPPPSYYRVDVEMLPEGTVYVDMLVYLPESDPYYTELVEENLPEGFSANAEIVRYCVDDFRSYTFHYTDAKSSIRVDGDLCVLFFTDGSDRWEDVRHEHTNDVERKGEFRLAMLDEAGNILAVSPLIPLQPRTFMGCLRGTITYNAATEEYEIPEFTMSFGVGLYLILAFVGMIITCATELVVARILRLKKKYDGRILGTNIVSQILMHALYIGLYSVVFWRYNVALIVLELLVYAGEFLAYRFWIMRDLSTRKILLFTVIANTASLGLGILLLRCLGILF